MSKAFTKSLFLFYKFLVRRLKAIRSTTRSATTPTTNAKLHKRMSTMPSLSTLPSYQVSMCKVEGGLLMSSSTFPYFMLVALEGGGLLRGLLLLLLYPFLCMLSHEVGLKVMVMVCFLGLRKEKFRLGRAVVPKLFLEDVNMEVFEVVRRSKRSVYLSGMPRVMIEGFLQEYLEIDVVVAPELEEFKGFYLGLMEEESKVLEGLDLEEVIEVLKDGGAVGIGGLGYSFHELFQHCKVSYDQSF